MKRTRKQWKEHFDSQDTWHVVKKEPEFGIQITKLVGAKIYALEKWFEPNEWVKELGATAHWMQAFYFTIKESDDGAIVPVDDNKTNLLNRLYKGELQCD